jgi:preprotein translocase subunit SecD
MATPTQFPDVDGGGWAIEATLGERGAEAMSAATRTSVAQPEPRNKLAIVVDGVVVSAPIVNEAIDSGRFVITGVTGKADTQALIARIMA